MTRIYSIKIYLLLIIGFYFFSSCKSEQNSLLIATAANMQHTVEELIVEFQLETGIKCETIVSSSGKLTAQIKEGAPFDVFISADTKYPNELYLSGFAINKPQIYAYGNLILWSLKDDIPVSIDSLTSSKIKHIAIANPLNAPYGLAAEETLKHYGIYDQIIAKLVIGESIGQTNQFILSKAAEIGFTAKSTVTTASMSLKGNFIEISNNAHQPLAQSAIILKKEGNNYNDSEKFFNFLFSKKGKEILKKNGYTLINNE